VGSNRNAASLPAIAMFGLSPSLHKDLLSNCNSVRWLAELTSSLVYRRYVLAVLLVLNKFVIVRSRYYKPFRAVVVPRSKVYFAGPRTKRSMAPP
jgi:hypothetical protein